MTALQGAAYGVLILAFVGLAFLSPHFAWEIPQFQRPTYAFAGVLLAASLAFVCVRWSGAPTRERLFALIALGAILRLLMMGSTPIWEDDFHRYLWDGGAILAGLNPYSMAPADLLDPALAQQHRDWAALAAQEGDLLQRVNYPQFRTIYPGVAQLAFALAHALGDGSVLGLRGLLLAADIGCLGLLLGVLKHLGRSPLWVGLYWLNPLIAKEFINSAHIDALLGPLLIGAVWAALLSRPGLMGACIGLAAGVKLWPILLWPLLVRHAARGRLLPALRSGALAAGILGLSTAPLLLAGLDHQAGLVAFADGWVRNSAWHPLFFTGIEEAVRAVGLLQAIDPGRLARALLACAAIAAAVTLALRDAALTPERLLARAFAVCAVIILLSPTQFPWYWAATLPFAVLANRPLWAWALALAMPAYYLRFTLDGEGWAAAALAWGQHILLWGALVWPMAVTRRSTL